MGANLKQSQIVNSNLYSMRVFLDKNKVKKQGLFENLTFRLVVNSLQYTELNTQS